MSKLEVWTYYAADANALERQVQELIDRGGNVLSLAIGYGPSPAKVAGQPFSGDTWHAMMVVDTSGIDPNS